MAAPGIDTFGATVRVQIQTLRICQYWTFVHMYIWSWTVLRCWRMARQQCRLWGSLTSSSTVASSPWEGEVALEGCNGGCAPLRDPLGGSCSSALISSPWNLWNVLHLAGESPAQEAHSFLCHNMVTVAQDNSFLRASRQSINRSWVTWLLNVSMLYRTNVYSSKASDTVKSSLFTLKA